MANTEPMTCKNCARFQRLNPLEKLGGCEVVVKLSFNMPDDADQRIVHQQASDFVNLSKSKVYVGENFGCIHFKSK